MSDLAHPRRPLFLDAGWRAVAAAFVLNGLLFGAWAARVPAFKEGFALEPAALGFLLLALAGGAILSFPLAGLLSERWGPERLSVRCAMGYVPALVLLALMPGPLALGGALFLFGAFHGAMDVAMNGWAARVETRLGRSTMSVFHALFSLGAGLGAASGFLAVRLGLDPLAHFAVVAMPGGVLALAAMIPAARGVGAGPVPGEDTPLIALPTGPLFLVGLIAFAISMGEGAMADWSAVFLRLATGATEAQAALGYAVFSTAMVATRLAGDIGVQRFGPVSVTRASGAVAFCGLAIAILSDRLVPALAGFSLVGVGYAVVMPLVFSRAAREPGMRPGPAIAAVATLAYGGMLLGPAVIGFIAQVTGLRVSFAVLAALAGLAIILAPRLRVR
ncbi:MFS transporter [Oceaniglobus trochenteri]|uniref:MFS transporter n=1 Tax=Oceaniglobus trochenteri TaxID=2763260 RepID=UPI001D001245|nr:MFS transporter [Oceaniglobus trochenteri]